MKKNFNFNTANFLKKKNIKIEKKFLRIKRLNFLKNLIVKKKKTESIRVWHRNFYSYNF